MKLFKKITFILLFISIPTHVLADTELTITNINNNAQGDCVLLESHSKYLLMDTCSKNDILIDYLKENNINSFSIYISHYHGDHHGNVLPILEDDSFSVEKLYLPNHQYLLNAHTEEIKNNDIESWNTMNSYINVYNTIIQTATNKNIEIKNLWVGDQFTFEDATIKIIGPIANVSLSQFTSDNGGTAAGHYINNNSLVAIVQVGNTKYFTAGDIEKEEENALIESGIDLSSDIMKLSHHGGWTSNTIEFIQSINPKYAFYTFKESNFNTNPEIKDTITPILKIANVYSKSYNGNTSFQIKNDNITITPEKNYYTLKVNYIDSNTKEILESKEYNFNSAAPYHLYYHHIDGYEYSEELNKEQLINEEILTSNKVINLQYNKIIEEKEKKTIENNNKQEENNILENPKTGMLLIFINISILIGAIILCYTNSKKLNNS